MSEKDRRHFWEMAFCAAFQDKDAGPNDAAMCADGALSEWESRWCIKEGKNG